MFKSYGPYHLARLGALREIHDVLPLEFCDDDHDYDWRMNAQKRAMGVHTLSEIDAIRPALLRFRLDAVAIPGYGETMALAVARLCRRLGIPRILMSDTHAGSTRNSLVRNLLKRRLLTLFDAALVAGAPHVDYLAQLGFDRRRIARGYDVVNNRHFAEGRTGTQGVPSGKRRAAPPYFFCCARLVEKKNLAVLIDAFAIYRSRVESGAWDLVIAGGGPLRENLSRQIAERNIGACVHLVGVKTYDELPELYANAGTFVLPSGCDEWGLVVNEAMAAGLPILVSNAAGCRRDLVRDGLNGYGFDPCNREQLAARLQSIAHASEPSRVRMGHASRRIMRRWDLGRFVSGMGDAISMARDYHAPRRAYVGEAIAIALSYRGRA